MLMTYNVDNMTRHISNQLLLAFAPILTVASIAHSLPHSSLHSSNVVVSFITHALSYSLLTRLSSTALGTVIEMDCVNCRLN